MTNWTQASKMLNIVIAKKEHMTTTRTTASQEWASAAMLLRKANLALAAKLTPKQKKIDLNKNGKVDGDDLKKLRNEKAAYERAYYPQAKADFSAEARSFTKNMNQAAKLFNELKSAVRRNPGDIQLSLQMREANDHMERVVSALYETNEESFYG
jgi:hypothetical protein